MPMEARMSAAAPNMVRSSILKLSLAVERITISSMGRTRATGKPPLA